MSVVSSHGLQGLLKSRSSNLGTTNQNAGHTSAPERPAAPVEGNINHHSIEVCWEESLKKANNVSPEKGDNRVRVTVQEQDKTGIWGNVYTGYSGRHTIEGLETWTTYKYRIRFMNDHGCSEWSPVLSISTTKEPYTGEHLNKAVVRQNLADITRILDSGEVNIDTADKYGYTPVMQAAQKEYIEILEVLLEHKPDVNFQNDSGKTALMLAAFSGKLGSVKELRYHGAKYDVHDKGGSTALHWAMDGGNIELIKWMVKDGADVSITDINGWTPLLRTGAVGGNHNAASILIRNKADVNARDNDGKTTLMLAVVNGHQALVELLLNSNADLSIKNEYGKTAYEMAISMEKRACMKVFDEFQQNGPKPQTPDSDE